MRSPVTGHYVENSVAGETVQAFVPAPLPPRLPANRLAGLSGHLKDAQTALAKLDLAGEMIPSLNWFIYAFVRKEALLSSEIEGTQATLVDVLSYEQTKQLGSSSIEDIEEVTNYVQAINHGLAQMHSNRGLPISVRLLNECHGILMRGVRSAYDENRLAALVKADAIYRATQSGLDFEDFNLPETDRHLMRQIDGSKSVEDLIAISEMPRQRVLASIHALALLDTIELAPPPRARLRALF